MAILPEIQNDLVSEKTAIGPILMKLRLLAAKLGSRDLELWIRHESEGYPTNESLPEYRRVGMSFSGYFSGPFGKEIRNAPIPPILIEKFAGEDWKYLHLKDSAAAIDSLIQMGEGIHLDMSNLMLLLQGHIYDGYACNQIKGYVSQHAIVEVANSIRNKILAFTIEFEKSMPEAVNFDIAAMRRAPEVTTQVFHQTVHGNLTSINNTGSHLSMDIQVRAGSKGELESTLLRAGLDHSSASEIASIISDEAPAVDSADGLGNRARKWLADRLTRGIDAGVKGGASALVGIVQEAAMRYWSLR